MGSVSAQHVWLQHGALNLTCHPSRPSLPSADVGGYGPSPPPKNEEACEALLLDTHENSKAPRPLILDMSPANTVSYIGIV